MIKRFALIFAIMLLISGCSPKDDKVVVQFASWGSKSEVAILKPILEEFEKENPNIKVDFLHIPQNYFQKLHLLFASNTAPDVIFINNLNLPMYADAGLLAEITPKEKELYYLKSLEALSWKGKLYAVPRDISTLVIFYNKDLFKSAQVAFPTPNWTMPDLLDKAQKLTGNGIYGISFEEDLMFYLPYLMSEGADFRENSEALQFYADLRKKYHVAPLKSESASATMAQMFLQGKLAMHLTGRWLVPKYRNEAKFNWDVVNFPRGKEGSVVPLDASGWAITAQSEHELEAKQLIDFLASEESIEAFTASGLIVPARVDVAESTNFLDGEKPKTAEVFLEVIDTAKPTPVTLDYKEVTDKLKQQNEILFN